MTLSLDTLSVEIIYHIWDNLSEKVIFLSMRNACQRFNIIIDIRQCSPLCFKLAFNLSRNIIHFINESHFSMLSLAHLSVRSKKQKYVLI
jgi:hypothetical protein